MLADIKAYGCTPLDEAYLLRQAEFEHMMINSGMFFPNGVHKVKEKQTNTANDRQIGGEHYKAAFQHWDFVQLAQLGYLEGCATKYLARWRKKNGLQDLEKALHYIDKMLEGVATDALNPAATMHRSGVVKRFCEEGGVDRRDTFAISLLCTWVTRHHLELARRCVEEMVAGEILAQQAAPEGTQAGCCAHEEPERTYVRSLEVEQARVENDKVGLSFPLTLVLAEGMSVHYECVGGVAHVVIK